VGVTMSVQQNQDSWWGEGDDMFFNDGEKTPSINGTGSEDYFLGAWDFGGHAFSYPLYGAPVVGAERAERGSSVYRFHLDSPIPLQTRSRPRSNTDTRIIAPIIILQWRTGTRQSLTWLFRRCLPWGDRLPKIYPVGGPGNAGK
jgi:hypothetical protein